MLVQHLFCSSCVIFIEISNNIYDHKFTKQCILSRILLFRGVSCTYFYNDWANLSILSYIPYGEKVKYNLKFSTPCNKFCDNFQTLYEPPKCLRLNKVKFLGVEKIQNCVHFTLCEKPINCFISFMTKTTVSINIYNDISW